MDSRISSEKRSRSNERHERQGFRRRISRSKSRSPRNKRFQRSRSNSPFRRRFNRRSPFRGGRNFRGGRFRRSRSNSRGRFDRKDRRFDSRRSRSNSPPNERTDNNYRQQMNYQNDPYNYMQAPVAPTFDPMNQFNIYEFQGNYPPAPNFSNISCPAPPGMSDWIPQQNMPQTMNTLIPEESEEDKKKREAAIAEEKKRQREGLKMQRDQYISRAEKMKSGLKVLKDKKADLIEGVGKRSISPKTNGFIKENEKLQSEISMKLSEILNVIDMLNGIIGKDDEEAPKKKSSKRSKKSESDDSSPERIKSELLESMKRKKQEAEEKKEKVNYVYYDNELHWCKHCQVFPKTAKDYLSHLHTKEHLDKIANRDGPWRTSFQKVNEIPNYPDAPTENVPIRGLQFFEPSTAWFCKLCEMFMGDSWCVSLHLKSEIHSQRYNKLIEREPKFEEKWQEARNKAYELSGLGIPPQDPVSNNSNDNSESKKLVDKKIKKKKSKKDSKKKRKHGKKRKRGSSTSSSDTGGDNSGSTSESESSSKKNDSDQVTDTKNSIRVAMRNILTKGSNENDERSGKWTMVPIDSNKPLAPPAPTISVNAAKELKKDEQIIGQWSTVEPIISPEEKRLLENLKGRLKSSQKSDVAESVDKQSVEKRETFRDKDRLRSRSRDRNRSDRNYRNRKSRSRSNSRRRSRSISRRRSKSRSNSRRKSRSISRRKSRSVDRRRRSRSRSESRRSRSRNRDRYNNRRRYSKSRSRSRGRYEKASINFSTEPKLPPFKDEKKLPSRSYSSSTKSSSSSLAKKMPFIGKMPVFKKQILEKKTEEQPEESQKEEPPEIKEEPERKMRMDEKNEKWDELMPDPLQFSAMMNAQQQQQQMMHMNEQEIDAPPGLDAVLDYEDIPKPISDAPPLKTGPLPKDFQATLDLLFDGDMPKKAIIETPTIEVPNPETLPIMAPSDGPQMIMAEDLSQHAILYGNFYSQASSIQPVPPPPVEKVQEIVEDNKNDSTEMADESSDGFGKNQEDLEDLALLGIDVNDVGSGLW